MGEVFLPDIELPFPGTLSLSRYQFKPTPFDVGLHPVTTPFEKTSWDCRKTMAINSTFAPWNRFIHSMVCVAFLLVPNIPILLYLHPIYDLVGVDCDIYDNFIAQHQNCDKIASENRQFNFSYGFLSEFFLVLKLTFG